MSAASATSAAGGRRPEAPVPWRAGWPIVAAATALIAGACALLLARRGADVEGLRAVIRLTARTSLVLFLAAFTASPLARLRPGAPTRWLVRHRRYLGVSFAASHTMHLAAIVAFARVAPERFWSHTELATLVVGGVGYLLIAAMTATSFDRAVVWLGARRWQRLHTVGVYYLWGVFLVTYAAAGKAATLPEVVALLAALVLRLTARRRISSA
jgi:DMSO/TMAO reductase YedYZ heme-binding membrane subunit